MSVALIVLLADGPQNTGPDFGKASPIGLLIVVLLLIAVFALVWSMNRHLEKARVHFADEAQSVDGGGPPEAAREQSGELGG